ncbi:MAG: DNA-binding protein [Actinomycetota bacterium]
MPHHLVGPQEVAQLLGVTTQRVHQIVETYPDFPAPEVELAAGRIWKRAEVETWIKKYPNRGPGRPRRAES